jgi:hypothetical protein
VLCRKCGTKLADGSKRCMECGQATPRPRIAVWVLLLALIGIISWAATSKNPAAQEFRDGITGAQTRAIVDAPFSVEPHGFSSYKFTVPPGAVAVTVTGQFAASGGSENNIEVYLMADSAFVAWSNGYSTGTRYESGRVAQGTIDVSLPAGSGIYYLVFSNKFSPRTPKAVRAQALVHFNTLIGEWFYRLKEWLGL